MNHCVENVKITHNEFNHWVFLDFLKTVSDGNWNLKVHKNQVL